MRGGETKRQQLQRGQQQCGHCNRTVRAMAMAAEVEAELQTAWSLMQAIVLAHAQANALTELTRIAVAIATHCPGHRHWAIMIHHGPNRGGPCLGNDQWRVWFHAFHWHYNHACFWVVTCAMLYSVLMNEVCGGWNCTQIRNLVGF